MRIQIINGPNINLLGKREPSIYGAESFESYLEKLKEWYPSVEFAYYQSNVEGELINKIHETGFSYDGIVLNAGAYTHVHSLAGCHPCSYVSSRGGTYFQCSSAGGVSSQINDFLCMPRSNLRIRTEFLSSGSRIHCIRQQQIIVYLL